MFTLEMSKSEVTQRLMCSEAKVESQRLRTGKLAPDDWPRLTAACDKLAKAPIYVDDTGSINMMEIRSKSRRLKSRHPDLGLIVVDYLQLMSSAGNGENRVQEVSQISRSLKILARDLDVPIVALSQLSRAVEQRTDKRPILSDLREVGQHRAGRGPRRLHLPRRVLQRRVRPAGARRGDPRQAPQRPDRLDEALVPEALREVRGPRSRMTRSREQVLADLARRPPRSLPSARRAPHSDSAEGFSGSTFAGRLELDLDHGTFLCRRGPPGARRASDRPPAAAEAAA